MLRATSNNASESSLKTIYDQRRWSCPKGARASDLLELIRDHGLLPDYFDNSFDQLAATLKSGLPKVRGEECAHGQGARPRETPEYVAAYALHLAAAQILFLVEAHQPEEARMPNSTETGFEWDEEKGRSTLERCGIDFLDAIRIFDGWPVVHAPSDRAGEERWIVTGKLSGQMVSVVWTYRDGRIRIITARRARQNEQREYYENHAGGCDPPQG